jgi:hypothetical protein
MKVVETIRDWAPPVAGGFAGLAVGLFACKLIKDKYLSRKETPPSDQGEKEPLTSNKVENV